MKLYSKLKRFFAGLGIIGVATTAATVICVVAFICTIIVFQAYFALNGGGLGGPMPIWMILTLMGCIVVTPIGIVIAMSSALSETLKTYIAYMNGERTDIPMAVSQVPFVELRRMRLGLLRTFGTIRRRTEHLEQLAFVDARTGLPNRTALDEKMISAVAQASYEQPIAYLLLNIDGLSRATEIIGPSNEDQLIAEAGLRILETFGRITGTPGASLRGYTLAALESDDFGVLLPQARNREDVATIARGLRIAFAKPFDLKGQTVNIGLSGGIVMGPEDADTVGQLHRNASLALKLIRKEGKPGFRFYTPRLNRIERGRLRLETELREAVINREFKAVFQPKVDFRTGRIVGAEALARWRRPNGKIISPAAFIPLAEDTGLITQIGEQIIESACKSGVIWMKLGLEATVAVNVSPRQFEAGDLAEKVVNALKTSGLPPSRLELEITESIAVSNPDQVAAVMKPLRAMGVKLAIDDFGTGHSNLSMLTQLPFDVFKIDRQFVSALETDAQAPAIVEMILAMAETLGLKTVAEGVETPLQADFLRRRGCSIAQGYLYSAGLDHDAFLDFVRAWRPSTMQASRPVLASDREAS